MPPLPASLCPFLLAVDATAASLKNHEMRAVFLTSAREPSQWHPPFPGSILLVMTDVTQILSQIEQGDPSAAEQLLPLLDEE